MDCKNGLDAFQRLQEEVEDEFLEDNFNNGWERNDENTAFLLYMLATYQRKLDEYIMRRCDDVKPSGILKDSRMFEGAGWAESAEDYAVR